MRRISVRISPDRSHPLNLNFFGTIFGTTNAKKRNFWTPFRERPQTVAMGLGNAPHKGPRGPMWRLLGGIPPHKGPKGAHGAPQGPPQGGAGGPFLAFFWFLGPKDVLAGPGTQGTPNHTFLSPNGSPSHHFGHPRRGFAQNSAADLAR